MEQQDGQKDKSLAWFKLADLIARGEREKALNVYRLLSHSLQDRAYALQLEGDLLWYLDDKNFIEKYKQAAFLYQKEKRWIDAIALYEHLFVSAPFSYDLLPALLTFYAIVDWQDKFNLRTQDFEKAVQSGLIDSLQQEKTFLELLDLIVANRTEKQWLMQWFATHIHDFPTPLAARIKEVIELTA